VLQEGKEQRGCNLPAFEEIGQKRKEAQWQQMERQKYEAHIYDARRRKEKNEIIWTATFATIVIVMIIYAHSQWSPNNAVRIGEALIPGPVKIVSRNIHGIYANLMECIRTKADVICLQEAGVAEADVLDFTMQAAVAGHACKWGQPTQIAKTDGGKSGRRVATR
jgi:hypothetical protein